MSPNRLLPRCSGVVGCEVDVVPFQLEELAAAQPGVGRWPRLIDRGKSAHSARTRLHLG